MRDARSGGAVRAPHSTDHPTPLPELTNLNLGTCKDHWLPNTTPIKIFPKISLLTCTQHPTRTLCARRLGNGIQPRDGGEPNTRSHLLEVRRHKSPLPVLYTVKTREQSEANYPGEWDSGKRLWGEGTSESTCPPPLTYLPYAESRLFSN